MVCLFLVFTNPKLIYTLLFFFDCPVFLQYPFEQHVSQSLSLSSALPITLKTYMLFIPFVSKDRFIVCVWSFVKMILKKNKNEK